MRKEIIKGLALLLSVTTLITTGVTTQASELPLADAEKTEYESLLDKIDKVNEKEPEKVKVINSAEELDVVDTTVKESDSAFKSRRLIITSNAEIEFKDEAYRDNIKSVQKIDSPLQKIYIVEYASVKDTEAAYNFYTSKGYEVEIDTVSDSVEEVNNKDTDDKEVKSEDIASTNANKDTESLDELNKEEEKKNIVVAVLDTGLNNGEEIFTDRIIEGKNFVEDTDDVIDRNGHGTIMSRIVLTNVDNSEQTEGNVYILPIKVLNDEGVGTTLSAYKGIKYAIEKKVDVINLSMSGIGHSKLLESAINEAYNNNIPVVVSSGNDNKEITDYTPANIESAFTIGGADVTINESGEAEYVKAEYSNYGSDSNKIDYVTNGSYEYKRVIKDEEVTTTTNGTSVSAAYVTSFIAMLKQMALSDEDDSNDILSMNDVDASLAQSSTVIDNEKYFGRGYLSKENISLVLSDREDDIKEVEDITEDDEAIALKPASTGQFAAGILLCKKSRTFENRDSGTTTVPAGNYAILTYDAGSAIGHYAGHTTDPTQAFTIAALNAMAGAKERGTGTIEIHLGCDLNIDIGGRSDGFCHCIGEWATYELVIRGDDGNKDLVITDSKKVNAKPLFQANDLKIHNLNIRDDRQTDKTTSIAQGINRLDVIASTLKGSHAQEVIRMHKPGTSDAWIKMNGAVIDGQNSCERGLRLRVTRSCIDLYNAGWEPTKEDIIRTTFHKCTKYGIENQSPVEVLSSHSSYKNNGEYGVYNSGQISFFGDSTDIANNTTAGIFNTGTIKITDGFVRNNKDGIINNTTGSNLTITNTRGITSNTESGIANKGTCTVYAGSITSNKNGVYQQNGTFTFKGGTIGSNQYGVYNSASKTVTLEGGTISNNTKAGVYNPAKGIVKMTGGPVIESNSTVGIDNAGTINMSDGAIRNNKGYGINNTGTVNFTAGEIHSNQGTKPTSDTCNVGVYQNGTFTIGGSARVHNNSVYLPSAKYVKQNSGTFTGQAIITTATTDRTVGRQLVTGSGSSYTSKYSLAYGNSGGITNGYSVKDSDGSTFTGTSVGIRSGANNGMTSTSQYLSGQYSLKYDLNKSNYPGLSPSPSSYAATSFWWKEATTGQFNRTPTDN